MKDHVHAVKHGLLVLLPVLDEAGRAIIYYDTSLFNEWVPDADEVRHTALVKNTEEYDLGVAALYSSLYLNQNFHSHGSRGSKSGGISYMSQWRTQALGRKDLWF